MFSQVEMKQMGFLLKDFWPFTNTPDSFKFRGWKYLMHILVYYPPHNYQYVHMKLKFKTLVEFILSWIKYIQV